MEVNKEQFDRLEKAPSMVFNDITPKQPTESNTATQGGAIVGEVSESDILKAGNTAEINSFTGNGGGSTITPESGTASPGNNNTSVPIGGLINAPLVTDLVDSALPALVVVAMQYFFEVKIQKKELQLTEKEKAIINPVLQKYLDSINLDFTNPLTALLVTVGTIYGSKFIEKGATAVMEKKEKEAAEKAANKKIRDDLRMQSVDKVDAKKDIVNLNEANKQQAQAPVQEQVNEHGYTKSQWTEMRLEIKNKKGYSPNDKSILAALNKKHGK